jgi:hemolysin III
MREERVERRTPEELVNTITHGAGAVLSVVAAVVVVSLALTSGEPKLLAGALVYGMAMVLLYTASTLYHSCCRWPLKRRLQLLDHCAIYVFIAATYTPLALAALDGAWEWGMLTVIWSLAVAGVVYKLFLLGRWPRFSTFTYLGMGWIAAVALPVLLRTLDGTTVFWVVAGGLAYTLGTPFLHATRIRFSHGIWHGFVLTGSVCHYLAIVGLVAG